MSLGKVGWYKDGGDSMRCVERLTRLILTLSDLPLVYGGGTYLFIVSFHSSLCSELRVVGSGVLLMVGVVW